MQRHMGDAYLDVSIAVRAGPRHRIFTHHSLRTLSGMETKPSTHVQLAQSLRLALLFAAGYFLLDRISFIYPLHELNITPWDPQPPLAVALLFLKGWRWLPWIYATVLVSEFLSHDMPFHLFVSMVLAFVLVLGYALVAALMRGLLDVTSQLSTRQDVVNMVAAVVLGTGATGLCYVSLLCLGELLPWSGFPAALFRFWLGDTIGLLVILPLLLFLAEPSRRMELRDLMRDRSAVAPFVFVLAVLAIVFLRDESQQYKFFYLLLLPIIWIAARHGLAGAITAVAVVQAGVIVAVMSSDHEIIEVLELQTLLLSVVLTGLVLGVAVDEWRDASQRLARARQLTAVGEMATALAHELNQPLTALATYSDAMRLLAESASTDRSTIVETSERIRRVATRCADIVARFRALAPNRATHTERAEITSTVESAIATLGERIERSGARVNLDVEPELPPLRIDRERMGFVFQNLIANALDAASIDRAQAPTVRIVIRRDGPRHIRATLHDSGPGIPSDMTEKIFEPFFTEKPQGMGLGLAICRSVVESHGGRLWAEPDTHGVLHVRLPA